MKLLKLQVTRFGSYESLTFDFTETGLALISGPTGAGKSTLMEAVCWTLFGQTARGGNVDEVKSWTGEGLTTGEIEVDIGALNLRIYRIRGKGAQNDLYYKKGQDDDELRGKDITDTQKQIEQLLGVTADQYFTGAYFSEFSPTSTFFIDKPKARREVFENIADLSLPVRLGEAVVENRKCSKKDLEEVLREIDKSEGALQSAKESVARTYEEEKTWYSNKNKKLLILKDKIKNFKKEQKSQTKLIEARFAAFEDTRSANLKDLEDRLSELNFSKSDCRFLASDIEKYKEAIRESLETKCETCGGPVGHKEREELVETVEVLKSKLREMDGNSDAMQSYRAELNRVKLGVNPNVERLEEAKNRPNHYIQQLEEETASISPFQSGLSESIKNTTRLENKIRTLAEYRTSLDARIAALDHLYDLSYTLRASLLKNAVVGIQDATNRVLESHFDSELRVEFNMEDADNLDVYIQKNGNTCTYKQLSKGQRGLLKLAFITSIMEASANSNGVHFENLFFDEALSGLDGTLKTKAFGLFQELAKSHSSILVIDHDQEFQTLFDKKYSVSLVSDNSVLIEE